MNVKKILLIVLAVVAIASIVAIVIWRQRAGIVKVTTAVAAREDLVAIVSGTGQIKPKTYVNVGATAFGRITHLNVKEGDHVKAGAVLATVENVQPNATVDAQQATINSNKTTVESFKAAEATAVANVAAAKADLEQKQFDYIRAKALYDDKLIAKQDFDAKQAALDVSVATLAQRKAAVDQARAQTAAQLSVVQQSMASQRSNLDQLDRTISRAPFDGLVTNVPVREGETVVVGIQNAEGSTLMTLADMSVITAEVKVDETDIVNVRLGQTADITVDALPGRTFKGHVTEVGDQALLRTTGVATSQSTTGTEEAKDFKVVVTVDPASAQSPGVNLDELRPGLSTTAKIVTAQRPSTLTIPIQALVQRDVAAEKILADNNGEPRKVSSSEPEARTRPNLVQGVYLLNKVNGTDRAIFVPVSTGIIGATDVEVTGGIKPGDTIITGRYKILRTLKSGTKVKADNSVETTVDPSKS